MLVVNITQFGSDAVHGLRGCGKLHPAKLRTGLCTEIYASDASCPDICFRPVRIRSRMHPCAVLPDLQQNPFRAELSERQTELTVEISDISVKM